MGRGGRAGQEGTPRGNEKLYHIELLKILLNGKEEIVDDGMKWVREGKELDCIFLFFFIWAILRQRRLESFGESHTKNE